MVCGSGSVGRASPSQGERREFDSRLPLHVAACYAAIKMPAHMSGHF